MRTQLVLALSGVLVFPAAASAQRVHALAPEPTLRYDSLTATALTRIPVGVPLGGLVGGAIGAVIGLGVDSEYAPALIGGVGYVIGAGAGATVPSDGWLPAWKGETASLRGDGSVGFARNRIGEAWENPDGPGDGRDSWTWGVVAGGIARLVFTSVLSEALTAPPPRP